MFQSKPPIQREINKVHNVVWATIKCIACSLEEENDDSNNDFFYTPLRSPSKPIYVEIKEHMQIDNGIKHSRILLTYDERIMHQVLNARTTFCSRVHSIRKSLEKISHTLPSRSSFESKLQMLPTFWIEF
jgi:hypothetical protein